MLLRRGGCERRRFSRGLRDGGDAGRPCALHLPKQWLRNQARIASVGEPRYCCALLEKYAVDAEHGINLPARDALIENTTIDLCDFTKVFILVFDGVAVARSSRSKIIETIVN